MAICNKRRILIRLLKVRRPNDSVNKHPKRMQKAGNSMWLPAIKVEVRLWIAGGFNIKSTSNKRFKKKEFQFQKTQILRCQITWGRKTRLNRSENRLRRRNDGLSRNGRRGLNWWERSEWTGCYRLG
jgi:hypothetical protein